MNLIAHVEIPVRELERAMALYSAVFDIGFGEIVEIHGNRMAYFPFTPARTAPAALWLRARFTSPH